MQERLLTVHTDSFEFMCTSVNIFVKMTRHGENRKNLGLLQDSCKPQYSFYIHIEIVTDQQ